MTGVKEPSEPRYRDPLVRARAARSRALARLEAKRAQNSQRILQSDLNGELLKGSLYEGILELGLADVCMTEEGNIYSQVAIDRAVMILRRDNHWRVAVEECSISLPAGKYKSNGRMTKYIKGVFGRLRANWVRLVPYAGLALRVATGGKRLFQDQTCPSCGNHSMLYLSCGLYAMQMISRLCESASDVLVGLDCNPIAETYLLLTALAREHRLRLDKRLLNDTRVGAKTIVGFVPLGGRAYRLLLAGDLVFYTVTGVTSGISTGLTSVSKKAIAVGRNELDELYELLWVLCYPITRGAVLEGRDYQALLMARVEQLHATIVGDGLKLREYLLTPRSKTITGRPASLYSEWSAPRLQVVKNTRVVSWWEKVRGVELETPYRRRLILTSALTPLEKAQRIYMRLRSAT